MDADHIAERTAANRRVAADFFESLDESGLGTQSLCGEWTVREVLAHLTMPWTAKARAILPALLKARGSFDRASAEVAQQIAQRPVPELVAVLRRHADSRWSAPGVGPMGQMTDVAVHLRDCARPLDSEVDVPLHDWRLILEFLVTPSARRGFMPKGRVTGLRLRATDQPWEHGEGDELSGPSEAVALALLGRTVALSDCRGTGVEVLRTRS